MGIVLVRRVPVGIVLMDIVPVGIRANRGSGVGKTTLGNRLAVALGLPVFDGDDFHSPDNIAKLQRGEPLTNADRAAWIKALQRFIQTLLANDRGELACSAPRATYSLPFPLPLKGLLGAVLTQRSHHRQL